MAYKKYGYQSFESEVTGIIYDFECHSERTRYGFRHICELLIDGEYAAHVSCAYYNRTWERFTYESVLRKAIDKLPGAVAEALRAQIIDGTAEAEKKRCNAMLAAFETAYKAASPELKKALQNTEIRSEDDAKFVTALCKADAILRSL